ncbi:ATP-dependent DNA helicase PIF1 [Trichoderma harzianum]|uniref:ATP-dependent DNA helicase n=1 Tax=Trichoderma harzianum TaxID=5544 RepID=A0A0F9WTB9_TRIHA|nr:ATP-dependent DNA helicase PIF1 [Trichoderma harzianum]
MDENEKEAILDEFDGDEAIIDEIDEEYGPSLSFYRPIAYDPKRMLLSDATPILCKEQQDLIDLIATGRNVFFTGSAGCGKSTVLKAAIKMLRGKGKRVHIVAPTGRAALQVGGMSTWSYMGWTPDFHKLSIQKLIAKGFRKHIRKRLKKTDVLIIDEISMVENQHLERMNICMKAAIAWNDWRKMIANDDAAEFNCPENHGPFLGTHKWAFKSTAWEEANFIHVNLEEIHRQKDEYFIRVLQKCRLGVPFVAQEIATLMEHPCHIRKATKLLCTREKVARVNAENFKKLKTPTYEYKALDGFHPNHEIHSYLPQYN